MNQSKSMQLKLVVVAAGYCLAGGFTMSTSLFSSERPYQATEAAAISQDLLMARMSFALPPANVVLLRAMDQMFPFERVKPAGVPWRLGKRATPLEIVYQTNDNSRNLQDYLVRTRTNAMIVLKDGEIAFEGYFNGTDAHTRFGVMSISKSIVSMLVGAALARGDIENLDDPVTRYAPEYIGTAYEGVTLRQLLLMRSGVDFNEEGADFAAYMEKVIAGSQMRCGDFGKSLARAHAPGTTFNYSSPETCVLARTLEHATGQSLANLTERDLWQPAGMQHEAYWVLDGESGTGTAIANGGFNATAIDIALLGQLMLNGGRTADRQVLASDWVAQSTSTDGLPNQARRDGYAYQWWTQEKPSAFAGIGFAGQFLYVVPEERLVIVKFSYWPGGWDEQLEAETKVGFSAIIEALRQ